MRPSFVEMFAMHQHLDPGGVHLGVENGAKLIYGQEWPKMFIKISLAFVRRKR